MLLEGQRSDAARKHITHAQIQAHAVHQCKYVYSSCFNTFVLEGATTLKASSCDPGKVGTGWKLVRRTPGNMHSATDNLAGTQTYGNPTDPTGSTAFSVNFETAVPKWSEIMLTTGTCNHWMIMSKQAAVGDSHNSQRQVMQSYLNMTEATAHAMMHEGREAWRFSDRVLPYKIYVRDHGGKSGPWLQPERKYSQASALYVEGNYNANSGNGEGAKYRGLNVYVRKGTGVEPSTCPNASMCTRSFPWSTHMHGSMHTNLSCRVHAPVTQ